jgi:hypothetical protein
MILTTFTLIHVLISFTAIISGFVVVFALLRRGLPARWTRIFWTTTALTSLTGFLFPFHGVTPAFVLGFIALAVFAAAMFASRSRWRKTYAVTIVLSLYFNIFVLIVQSFQKIPALKDLAPTQTEAPFKLTQLVVLILFTALGVAAAIRSRDQVIQTQVKGDV